MFGSLFSLDSPLGQALSKFTDILILNLLFVLCSIPIITIGASYTALYSVTRRLVKDEEHHIVRSFFKAFKSNFRQATIIWLILLVFGCLLFAALYLTAQMEMVVPNRLLLAVLCLYGVELSYVFPLLSQFGSGVVDHIRNALFLGIARLPWTVLILLIDLCPVILMLTQAKLLFLVPPIMLLAGFGLTAFCNCFIFNHIFKRYIPPAED